MFARKIGIDLGTSTLQVYVRGEGVVADEPCVAAVDLHEQRLRAIGRPALDLASQPGVPVRLIRPVARGAVADAWLARRILVDLVTRVQGRRRLFRPEVMLCVPAGAPGDQRRALIDAAMTAGARQAWLIEAPLSAALGLGLPVAESSPQGICDIGGGLIQVAVVSLSGIAASHVVPSGGEQLDGRLAALLRQRRGLDLDRTAAEAMKIAIGAAVTLDQPMSAEIEGMTVTSDELTGTVQDWLASVVEAVRLVLDQTPKRLAARVAERGFLLTGGGALMPGIDRHLSGETGIPFQVAGEPRTCAVRGTRRGLGDFEVVRRRRLYLGGC